MSVPIVQVKQGQLQGKFLNSYDGHIIYGYLGIPYAKTPVGKLRFRAPQPPESWNGVRDATKHGDNCICQDFLTKQFAGSEDCLYLNVYTRNVKPKTLKPVMVFIHGGAFTTGSGNIDYYGPDYLMTEDVLLVTINYRTGLLGFLSLDDETLGVPGNAGFKDQVMALKWVQENIECFGGDPKNVTIFGESAGGASVHLLYLSPMAKGLFQKAIAQSGCAINNWVPLGSHIEDLKALTGVENGDRALLETLENMELMEMYKLQLALDDCIYYGTDKRKIGVAIEKTSLEPTFLSEHPWDIMKRGDHANVPLMMGYTDKEGLIDILMEKTGMIREREMYPKNFEYFVPHSLNFEFGSKESKEIGAKMKEFYSKNQDLSDENIDPKFHIKSDILFVRGIQSCVKNHVKYGTAPVYLYRMVLTTALNVFKSMICPEADGVCHADDIGYLFKTMFSPSFEIGSIEETSVRRFVKMWTSFAATGNPTQEENNFVNLKWLPVEKNKMNYLEIGENLVMCVNPDAERMKFWDDIAATYNKNI